MSFERNLKSGNVGNKGRLSEEFRQRAKGLAARVIRIFNKTAKSARRNPRLGQTIVAIGNICRRPRSRGIASTVR
jgi:hypothetical protein